MATNDYGQLPILPLSEVEQIWVSKLYEIFKQNRKLSYRQLRAELLGKLPYHFQRSDVDNRLVRYGIDNISLLGVVAIEKNYDVLKKADSIVGAIRDMLIKNPIKDQFLMKEIAEAVGMSEIEAGLIFELLAYHGRFYGSAGKTGIDTVACEEFKIGHGDDAFNFYMNYEGVTALLFAEEEQEEGRLLLLSQEQAKESEIVIPVRGIAPIFSERPTGINHKVGFILMPFTAEWSERVYKHIIRDHVESLGLQCVRADNKHGPIIMEDIWISINHAAFIVADTTGKNPNVMYELGIAHSLGKPTILITQDTEAITFDHKHLRHYQYRDQVGGASYFADNFKDAIKELYQKYYPKIKLEKIA